MLRLNKCVKNKNLVSSLFLSSLRLSTRLNNFIPKSIISNFSSKREGDVNYDYNSGPYDHLKRKTITSTDSDLSDLEETVEFYKEESTGRKRSETRIMVEDESDSHDIGNNQLQVNKGEDTSDMSAHFLMDRNFKCNLRHQYFYIIHNFTF
jgi:hypothetical protein